MTRKKTSLLANYLSIFIFSFCVYGCTTLRPATSIKNGDIDNYQYFYISHISSLTSSSGATVSGQYYSSSKTINPSELITGKLAKERFIRLPELKPELIDKTLIINYGESGKRKTGILGGYTLEVTIQFVSANSSSLLCSCTAEGKGSTEADDIRQAITRCLNEFLPPEN